MFINYISCGYEKYGNPRVIMQMKEFGMWIDGYPSMNININNNTTYSIAIVNPYKIINSFMLEINSLKIKKSFRVPSQSVKQINLYDIEINGCTDDLAMNYMPNATVDDSSCIYASCYYLGFDILEAEITLSESNFGDGYTLNIPITKFIILI